MLSLLSVATLLLHVASTSASPVSQSAAAQTTHNASVPDVGGDAASNVSADSSNVTVPKPGYNAFANATKTSTATLCVDNRDVTVNGVSADGVDAFLGIPFAAPPVDDLRWKRPQAAQYPDSIDATTQPKACPQYPGDPAFGDLAAARYGTSEDCLTLSVLAPEATQPDAKLPVMVWVYGGGYAEGTGSTFNSPLLVNAGTDAPIVLVTFNYRLGMLGFPYGRDAEANCAANLGLFDMIAAFQWVKEHIGAFGGDPDRVTAFGGSAGAVALSYLLFNEEQDLFSGVIMQSGAPSTLGVPLVNSSNEAYDKILASAGCSDWECLRHVPADRLLNVSSQVGGFAPVQDGELINGIPYEIVRDGKLSDTPFISGNNEDEATLFLPVTTTMDDLRTSLTGTPIPDDVWAKILAAYPANATYPPPGIENATSASGEPVQISPDYRRAAAIMGDKMFQSRRRWLLAHARNQNTTYTYEFTGRYRQFFPPAVGAGHGLELYYLFGWLGIDPRSSADEVALGKQMMNYWINFAYHRDPNRPDAASPCANATGAAQQPRWAPYAEGKASQLLAPGHVTQITDDFRPGMSVFDEPDVAKVMGYL